jgi:hypothetical protein
MPGSLLIFKQLLGAHSSRLIRICILQQAIPIMVFVAKSLGGGIKVIEDVRR